MNRTTTFFLVCMMFLWSLVLVWAASAQESPSNAPPVEATEQSAGIKISTDDEKVIPKEVADKLTSDQLYQLMRTRMQQNEDIPGLAPLIVAIVFGCPVAIVAVVLIYRYRKNVMLHRTLAAMIDKGVPIPPELLQPERPDRTSKSDLRRGLILIGVGAGLIVFFVFQSRNAIGIGFIPLLIGVGYLIAWKLEQKKQNGQNPS
jgi:Domain of unknown function (DUF6249)